MKVELTMKEIWHNHSLRHYLFRQQSIDTIEELIRRAAISEDLVLEVIEQAAFDADMTSDEVDELFYEESVKYIADDWNIELNDETESEEE